ncbi:hypothetical protein V502_04412 [Pseudogymnoascus sp. VKM F-4520 (FW-2644)]|nr:hypothetical protein V502_04412 [Pseudogymnoascus sp. VKM F-4520 (FW-2644)]
MERSAFWISVLCDPSAGADSASVSCNSASCFAEIDAADDENGGESDELFHIQKPRYDLRVRIVVDGRRGGQLNRGVKTQRPMPLQRVRPLRDEEEPECASAEERLARRHSHIRSLLMQPQRLHQRDRLAQMEPGRVMLIAIEEAREDEEAGLCVFQGGRLDVIAHCARAAHFVDEVCGCEGRGGEGEGGVRLLVVGYLGAGCGAEGGDEGVFGGAGAEVGEGVGVEVAFVEDGRERVFVLEEALGELLDESCGEERGGLEAEDVFVGGPAAAGGGGDGGGVARRYVLRGWHGGWYPVPLLLHLHLQDGPWGSFRGSFGALLLGHGEICALQLRDGAMAAWTRSVAFDLPGVAAITCLLDLWRTVHALEGRRRHGGGGGLRRYGGDRMSVTIISAEHAASGRRAAHRGARGSRIAYGLCGDNGGR